MSFVQVQICHLFLISEKSNFKNDIDSTHLHISSFHSKQTTISIPASIIFPVCLFGLWAGTCCCDQLIKVLTMLSNLAALQRRLNSYDITLDKQKLHGTQKLKYFPHLLIFQPVSHVTFHFASFS